MEVNATPRKDRSPELPEKGNAETSLPLGQEKKKKELVLNLEKNIFSCLFRV